MAVGGGWAGERGELVVAGRCGSTAVARFAGVDGYVWGFRDVVGGNGGAAEGVCVCGCG